MGMIAETVFKNIVNERRIVTPGREFGQQNSGFQEIFCAQNYARHV